ncbi:hypothetical protein [Ferruginibacter sp. HRS2-29]|uniref:hypothetical protein n=1 Tax=Ferruginibacter sp. HRS2-29 TaxID=2487334 RepID=UPI0020CE8F63|nr:hypothetical protein [Ferruginibacter sp. HRS2-29]MCP9751706.1 hypothetical protein [Ferruginibacter sp. HRS2-29]
MAIVICFTLCIQTVAGQSIQTSIDRKDILIGEPITYRLQFTLPTTTYRIEFNVPDSFPHFEIMDKVKSDSNNARGNYLVLQTLVLTSWDSGSWAIPSFPIKIRNTADNAVYTLNTDQVLINVGYAKADTTGQLRDIKPVMDVFYFDPFWVYVGIGVVILLVLLFLLYRYIRRRPKRQPPLFNSALSPFEEAMQELKKLAGHASVGSDEAKVFYTMMGNIFKRYYSRKKQQDLLNKTTGEVLLSLKQTNLDASALSGLAEALRRADAVKFAKYVPAEDENRQSLSQVGNTIEQIEKSIDKN